MPEVRDKQGLMVRRKKTVEDLMIRDRENPIATPRKVWVEMHARYGKLLGCSCRLRFSEDVTNAEHRHNEDDSTCWITINPTIHFLRPEHLILHEFAHHRLITPLLFTDLGLDEDWIEKIQKENHECCVFGGGHCEHFAHTLMDMYHETSTELPYSTMFEKFAKLAGIKYKVFDRFNAKTWGK